MRTTLGSLLIFGSLGWGQALANERWIHIKVDDAGDTKAHVDLQVPLGLVSTLLPALQGQHGEHGIQIDGTDVDLAELRECWKSLRHAKDGEYLTLRDAGSQVRVAKSGGVFSLLVDDDGGRSHVRMKVPIPIMDAVLAGGGDTIDLDALSGALENAPAGDLITVDDANSHVRIWIDSAAAPAREERR